MADLDLAGIITRTCANLRLRFSKVAVLRILTSGTKSATVTVDGVKYDLYAPTPPTASTTAPLMDGTASYGSGTSYARSNHVHPTDTSRQATLVSGTNIKTINGDSILGSGDLTISGGGGGMLVTFTTPDHGGTYTADKTFGEIFAAFGSGIQPIFKFISANTTTTYTTIRDVGTNNSSTPYRIVFSSFYTTALYGAANDYPSWSSDN